MTKVYYERCIKGVEVIEESHGKEIEERKMTVFLHFW